MQATRQGDITRYDDAEVIEDTMKTTEAINELIDIGNTLQIQPRSPKGKALLMAIKSLQNTGD